MSGKARQARHTGTSNNQSRSISALTKRLKDAEAVVDGVRAALAIHVDFKDPPDVAEAVRIVVTRMSFAEAIVHSYQVVEALSEKDFETLLAQAAGKKTPAEERDEARAQVALLRDALLSHPDSHRTRLNEEYDRSNKSTVAFVRQFNKFERLSRAAIAATAPADEKPKKATTYHVTIDVDIDRFSDRVLERNWLPFFQGHASTVAELRALCAEARERGQEVFAACDNSDPVTGKCQGHAEEPR